MKTRKKVLSLGLCGALFFLTMNRAPANEDSFTGLITYLGHQYGSPFQVIGKVKEASENRLIFSQSDTPLQKGQWLWVIEGKKGISPSLQPQVARIQVEALFSDSVLARVDQITGRPVETNDWIVTPPAPLIYIYTNITAKHAFPPYQQLLKALIAAHYKVEEITGDALVGKPGPNDLLIRLEGEEGHLVCQLTSVAGGPLLYSETLAGQGEVRTAYPTGHAIRWISAPGSLPKTAHQHLQVAPAPPGAAYQLERPRERTDYYRLSGAFSRVVYCDLEGDSGPELALLGQDGTVVYGLGSGGLIEKCRYPFGEAYYFPLHLHAMDINGDGGDELFLSLSRPIQALDKEDNELCSEILTFRGGKLEAVIKAWPFYLRVIRERKGAAVALAQKEGVYTQYAGPIYSVGWNETDKGVEIVDAYRPAQGIYSIYQFNLVPGDTQRVIILEPNNDLRGYFAPEERMEAAGERNYGEYREMAYPLKLEKDDYLGGFDNKKTCQEVYAARRFELAPTLDGQSFLIYKERGNSMLLSVLKTFTRPSQGMDQVVGVKWSGERIVETWETKRLAKDVLDFTFLKDPARILVLYRDGDEYAIETFH